MFKKEGALLRKSIPAKWQASLRRRMRARYLLWDGREYRAWLHRQLEARKTRYACNLETGLLSLLTPVWDGTPLRYFQSLAESVVEQNSSGATEWVILDNGCKNKKILAFLSTLKQRHHWITITRSAGNAGIVGGLRLCLEAASGRYVLPVDSDDWLCPDCLQVVTWWIRNRNFPPLLYTDEDKVIGPHAVQPYLKPAFDPVLLLNSAYIAHLGVIDRKLALAHEAYADKSTEGSPDWDLFIRFFLAGYPAVHIPEIVYSWRMHPESTADDAGSKPYIHSSQKAVLQRYLDASGFADKYDVEYSPLLPGSCDWWLHRRPVGASPAVLISVTTGAAPRQQPLDYPELPRVSVLPDLSLEVFADGFSLTGRSEDDFICLVGDDLEIDRADWLWEALGLFERYPDTAMVGGRIRNGAGSIISAGYVFGFGRGCDCPDRGRPALDPGYFTQMMKQRSVSAVSAQFAVLRVGTLYELTNESPASATVAMLGAWAGAWALRNDRRVIYSPYLSAVSNIDWDALRSPKENAEFQSANADLMPDRRFYPAPLGMQPELAYRLPESATAR